MSDRATPEILDADFISVSARGRSAVYKNDHGWGKAQVFERFEGSDAEFVKGLVAGGSKVAVLNEALHLLDAHGDFPDEIEPDAPVSTAHVLTVEIARLRQQAKDAAHEDALGGGYGTDHSHSDLRADALEQALAIYRQYG